MKTIENDNFRLFSNAGVSDKSTVFSRKFKINFCSNQGFVVPWQMTEKKPTDMVDDQVIRYSHF